MAYTCNMLTVLPPPQDGSLFLIGPWYGTGVLAQGAFVLRKAIYLNTTNATVEWAIPEGLGWVTPLGPHGDLGIIVPYCFSSVLPLKSETLVKK